MAWIENPAEMVLEHCYGDSYQGDVLFDTELPQVDPLQTESSVVSSPLFVHIVRRGGIAGEHVNTECLIQSRKA